MGEESEAQDEPVEGEVFEDAQDGYMVVDKEEEPETPSAGPAGLKLANGIKPHDEQEVGAGLDAHRTLEAEV